VNEFSSNLGRNVTDDLNASGAKSFGTTAGDYAGIALREDNSGNSGIDQRQCTRTRASSVIARFECDDGSQSTCVFHFRQCIDFGVWSASTTVPTLGDDGATRVEQYTSDLWVLTRSWTAQR
jgi:hypothetical protein